MDKFTKEQRSKVMQAIKSKNTSEEILLAKAMWKRGLRYRKHNKKVFGNPDFTFSKYKIAIFVDGEFFHGFDWEVRKTKLISNRDFWINKIEKNIERDKDVNKYLLSAGWQVIRFWTKFLKKNLEVCVDIIESEIQSIKDKTLNKNINNL